MALPPERRGKVLFINGEQLYKRGRNQNTLEPEHIQHLLAGIAVLPVLASVYQTLVLTDVTSEMECAANETFGPLVSIYPVADVDEAVEKANDTEYGLNASVWAGSSAEGQQIAARLRSGTVNVNEGYAFAWGSLSAPMGGMGISGVGRRHGPEGLLKYTESQTIATARVFNLDAPFGIPQTLWQKSLLPIVRTVMKLPGRT